VRLGPAVAGLAAACVVAGPARAQTPQDPAPGAVSAPAASAEPEAGTPVLDPQSVVGPPRGRPLAGADLDARTEEVAALLRCPVCQGLSVGDSPSSMAQNMKRQVREMLAAGYEREQILAYFEASYGEFVRLEPQLRGVNWLVWLAPVAGLLAGAAVVAWTLRAPRAGSPAPAEGLKVSATGDEPAAGDEPPPGPDTLPDDDRLAAYVLQVRERVYGWPGGRSPSAAPAAPAAPPAREPATGSH
jgi:cytochrome c-type biogenesis protein CcmH